MTAGVRPSAAADIYNLGLLTFFALTGHPAFAAAAPLNRADLQDEQRTGLRCPSARAAALGRKLDTRLDRWFWMALDPIPDRRFKTASELALAFGQQLGVELRLADPSAPHPQASPLPPDRGTPFEALRPEGFPASGGHEEDEGIVAVSVKPLLFAGDLRALTSAAPRPVASTDPTSRAGMTVQPATGRWESQLIPVAILLAIATAAVVAGALLLPSAGPEASAPNEEAQTTASIAPQADEEMPHAEVHAAKKQATPADEKDAPDPAPPPSDDAEVLFECLPVPCQNIYCNARPYEPGAVQLAPGRYTCKGAAQGYGTSPVTLDLAAQERTTHRFQMVARPPASTAQRK